MGYAKYRIRLSNRRRRTQDRRELRPVCRWKIERLLAGLQNFRRLVNRWDYPETDVLGML